MSRLSIDANLVENVSQYNWLHLFSLFHIIQLVGTQLGIMISSTFVYCTIATLSFIYLDASAASLLMTALFMLATVPLITRTMLSVDTFNNTRIALEESNHVICSFFVH